ncbi:MAG: NTP transferase domain-containing protein [Syntrophaceae bacterium]|nr:NTP transferase domain-containing protein [Syntrophaceae bacterium]
MTGEEAIKRAREEKELLCLVLAAGKGTRMKSDLAKVLHALCGRPLLSYVVDAARRVGAVRTVIVVGHQADLVRESVQGEDLSFVEQREQLGTGHAVRIAREHFREWTGPILILCGDVPLLTAGTLEALLLDHRESGAAVTVLTTVLDEPGSYGRVIKGEDGEVLRIVEARDASEEEKRVREINAGIYCAGGGFLAEAVGEIRNENAQKEYYLTDIVEIARNRGLKVRSLVAAFPPEVMGINTPEDLGEAERLVRSGFLGPCTS